MPETLPDYRALHDDLTALFADVHLAPDIRGDWVLVDDAFPALRAHSQDGQLHIDIALYDGRMIRETYAASGGMAQFRDGVLPVLLSTFWARHNPGLVAREVWKRPDGPWLALIGPYLREVGNGEKVPVPYALFGLVRNYIHDLRLDDDLHWLSLQVSASDGRSHISARLDNVEQPLLTEILRDLDWPSGGRAHTLRNFMLLARS